MVPSNRNKFSLVPDPNAETLAGEAAAFTDWSEPLDGEVRVAALRRKLDFPQAMGRDQQSMQFAMQVIENQLQQALERWAEVEPRDGCRG